MPEQRRLSLRALEPSVASLSRNQAVAIATLVLLLHLLGLLWVDSLLGHPRGSEQPLQVVWLSADPAKPSDPPPVPMPRPPARSAVAAARDNPAPLVSPVPVAENVQLDNGKALLEQSTWLLPDGRIRWDQRQAEEPAWTDQDRISRNRIVQLPGSTDAAAAEKVAIRLRRAMTPEDVVLAVVRMLFGTVQKDDCRAIEGRLHMSDPGVTREIDMIKFRKRCAS